MRSGITLEGRARDSTIVLYEKPYVAFRGLPGGGVEAEGRSLERSSFEVSICHDRLGHQSVVQKGMSVDGKLLAICWCSCEEKIREMMALHVCIPKTEHAYKQCRYQRSVIPCTQGILSSFGVLSSSSSHEFSFHFSAFSPFAFSPSAFPSSVSSSPTSPPPEPQRTASTIM